MNVGNMIATLGGQGNAMTVGTPASEANAALSTLFAMQLGDAFAGMQQNLGLPMFQDPTSTEDLASLTELLAMIQQMLTGGGIQQPQLAEFTEKLDELNQVSGKWLQNIKTALTEADSQRLITTFTQQGLSQADANKIVELLAAIAQASETEKQQGGKQLVTQANQLLEQFGIKVKSDGKISLPDSRDGVTTRGTPKQKISYDAMLASKTVSQEMGNQVQPLRMNLGLAKYQAEAGVSGLYPVKGAAAVTSTQQVDLPEQAGLETASDTTYSIPVATNSQMSSASQLPTGTQSHLVRADQFAQELAQVFVKQIKLTGTNGVSEAKLILHPQSLGQVDVKITSQNGIITAHFTADSANGKELLDNQLPQLRAALVQQGLQVDRLEVSQQSEQPQLAYQQQREQARQQHEEDQQQKQQSKEERPEFSIDSLVDRAEPLTSLLNRLRMSGNIEYSA